MNATLTDSVPRYILNGIQDLSIRQAPVIPDQIPTHLPHCLIVASQGTDIPQLISQGADLLTEYGSDSFDYAQKYANHQTVLVNVLTTAANAMIVQRLIPDDAAKAMIRLSLEVVTDQVIPQYIRDADTGLFILDSNGEKQALMTTGCSPAPVTANGIVLIWHANLITGSDPSFIATGAAAPGTLAAAGPVPGSLNTTIAAGSNNAVLPQGTIYLASVAGLPTTGGAVLVLITTNGVPTLQYIPYTGVSGSTITGCVGGTGKLVTGAQVISVEGAASDVGQGSVEANLYPRVSGQADNIYPMIEFPMSDYGASGNLIGVRMSAPNAKTASPLNVSLVLQLKQYLYRFQAVQRPYNQTTPNPLQSNNGAASQDLTLAPNSINVNNDQQLALGKVFSQSFQNMTPAQGPQEMGPFSQVYVYNDNVALVQSLLFASEQAYLESSNDAWLPIDYTDSSYSGVMNLLSAIDFNGVPYATIQMGTVGEVDEVVFDSQLIGAVYGTGGADGDVSVQNFDLMAQNVFNTYATGPYNFQDDAFWPQSIIYDSGYTMATKKAMLTVLGARKDMALVLATYEDGTLTVNGGTTTWTPTNTQQSETDEQANAMALNTYASSYPESELYGTSTCRVLISGHSGYLTNSPYTRLLPLSLDIANKFAGYMGAGVGKWTNGQSPDTPPNNQVSLFYGINNTWKPSGAYAADWGLGLNWVQNNNRRAQFWPAFKSVYNNPTSTLNSWVVVLGCVQLEKVAMDAWRWCCGIEGLTDAQFIKRSNDFILKAANGVFDNRFVVIPETIITPGDELLGYRWTCRIHIYANNMKLVGSFTVVAHRQSDLSPNAASSSAVTG